MGISGVLIERVKSLRRYARRSHASGLRVASRPVVIKWYTDMEHTICHMLASGRILMDYRGLCHDSKSTRAPFKAQLQGKLSSEALMMLAAGCCQRQLLDFTSAMTWVHPLSSKEEHDSLSMVDLQQVVSGV